MTFYSVCVSWRHFISSHLFPLFNLCLPSQSESNPTAPAVMKQPCLINMAEKILPNAFYRKNSSSVEMFFSHLKVFVVGHDGLDKIKRYK